MKRILLTGMSGAGKSTLIRLLAEMGYKAIDVDTDQWSHWVDMHTGLPALHRPQANMAGMNSTGCGRRIAYSACCPWRTRKSCS